MKNILIDIWRNYRLGILAGALMVLVLTLHITEFDNENIYWYYIGITIASGGGIGCIVYGIKKMLNK